MANPVSDDCLTLIVCKTYNTPTAEISWWIAERKEVGGGIKITPEAFCFPEPREYVDDAGGLHANR